LDNQALDYKPLLQLIEAHKEEVAYNTAREALARKLPSYLGLPPEKLAPNFIPTIEMLSRYILHGDPEEYRTYIMKLTEQRLSQGYQVQDFYIMGEILTQVLIALVDAELPGAENAAARRRYQRRLTGIQTLAQSTVVATRFARHSNV
jgi:hypothetical protein